MSAPSEPFEVLGVSPVDATEDDVRNARRRLARELHPDRGGDAERMQTVNVAADAALDALRRRGREVSEAVPSPAPPRARRPGPFVERDDASFVVSALPAEAFEALYVVASWLGQVLVDDPPYLLECYVTEPTECFCRLELFPEAGGSMVAVTVVAADGAPWPPPSVDDVRDAFIAGLVELSGQTDTP